VSTARTPLAVALMNPFFWPEVRRGSERLMHDLAVDLLSLGDRPRVITSHPGRPGTTVEDGFPVVRNWRPPEKPLTLRSVEPHLSHVPFSYRSLARGEDDVAHAFYPTDALAALRWGRRTGRPSIFSYMGIPSRQVLARNRLRKTILEQAIAETDAVTALSRAARDGLWRWFGVEAPVVYPGVDLAAFSPGGRRAEHPTVACAGAADDGRKRIGLLVRAFALVRAQRPSARLLLTRPDAPELARELDEQPGVELVPKEHSVEAMFQEAWATGLASRDEAFGLVLVESMACGTPVFGAREGGIPEIVDRPEVGRLFDGDDEREVARTVLETLELAEDPGTAAACRARAEAFDTLSGARAYSDLYRQLIAG